MRLRMSFVQFALFAFTSSIFAISPSAYAEDKPLVFGFVMGQSLKSLSVVDDLGNGDSKVEAPTPNKLFSQYIVTQTPQTGVCGIMAFSEDNEDDSAGIHSRSLFETIKQLLTKKYGVSDDLDSIDADATWDKENEWLMAIKKGERHYISLWKVKDADQAKMQISTISLFILPTSEDSSSVGINYKFNNFDKCQSILDEANKSGL